MKRSFSFEIKRSKNFQTIGVNESFEDDISEEDFEKEKKALIERVKKQAQKELDNLGFEFKIEVEK